jgi:hypothetical protein
MDAMDAVERVVDAMDGLLSSTATFDTTTSFDTPTHGASQYILCWETFIIIIL